MAELKIYNDIVQDEEKVMLSWSGMDAMTFKDIDTFLTGIDASDTAINLTINCRGGDYDEGMAMYDALRQSGKEISATVVGQCSSIATLFLMAAKKGNRRATQNATILIHAPYIPEFTLAGAYHAEDLAKIAKDLEDANNKLLDIYVERTGSDRETLAAVMEQDTPITAQRAKELGLIDEVLLPKSAFRKPIGKNMDKKSSIKKAFAALGAALGIVDEKIVNMELETATGERLVLRKESGDPVVGDEVESPDGEYVMPDGSTIVVTDGVISEIRPAEEKPTEETTEVEVVNVGGDPLEESTEEKDKEIGDLEAEVERLHNDIAERDARIAELEAEVERLKGEAKTEDERNTLNMVAMAGGREWLERAKSEYKPKKSDLTPTTKRNVKAAELAGVRDLIKK